MKRRDVLASTATAAVGLSLPAVGSERGYVVTRYYEEFADGIKLTGVFVYSDGEVMILRPGDVFFTIGPNGELVRAS